MAFDKSALGNKHTCYGCEAKFYDMNVDPICPNCKADQRDGESITAGEAFLETLAKHKRKSSKSEEIVVKSEENKGLDPDTESDDDDEDEDEDEDELLASLSGEDEEEEEEEEE